MIAWQGVQARVRSLFFRSSREAELREELEQHLDREIEHLEAKGLRHDEARVQAVRRFGGVDQIKEQCRDARGTAALDAWLRDARHAARRLSRDWAFAGAAVLLLGLGIGANTAIFSLINAALLRGSTLHDSDRIVDIYQNASNPGALDGNSFPASLDMAAYTDVFAGVTAVSIPNGVSYERDGGLRTAIAEFTTASYPSVLGLTPALGRWFTASEDVRGAEVVAVLSHAAWNRKFGADPSIIGRTLRVESVPVTIVGVGPQGYNGTLNIGLVTDLWVPISAAPALGAPPHFLDRHPEEAAFFVKARLKDGVSVAQAQSAMTILGRRLADEYPKEDPGKGISVFPSSEVRVHPQMDRALRWFAVVLLGVVALVLAVACSNLATLLLVRGAARAKEVAMRLALGATRWQLVRHLLMESLLLSVAGGGVAAVLAWWTSRLLRSVDLPIVVDVTLDYRVLAFAIALSVVTGIAFGLAPALNATRIDLVPALRDDRETRSSDRKWFTLKNGLIVFQVAASVALLGATTIVLQLIRAAQGQTAGFAVDDVAMVQTDTRYAGYSAANAGTVLDDVRRRIAALPGVQSAAVSRGLPMQVDGVRVVIDRAADETAVSAGAIWAGPGFFDALRIPLLYGRALDERDRPDTRRVAVISEAMARQYFGSANAVGRRFRVEQDADGWFEVVGVARNTGTADWSGDLVDPKPQLFFRSVAQFAVPADAILARTSGDPTALSVSMQRELRRYDGTLPITAAKTMRQYLDESLTAPKAAAALLAVLGALGLCLAGIGLYAVVSFRVSRRFREIGIRLALGARRLQVVRAVTKELTVLLVAGTAVGLLLTGLAIAGMRSASAPAPGIALYRPTADPVALLIVAALMIAIGLAAAFVPAWRAARMDPLATLRHD